MGAYAEERPPKYPIALWMSTHPGVLRRCVRALVFGSGCRLGAFGCSIVEEIDHPTASVRVHVEGERDRGMPELRLHRLGIGARLVQERRGRMSQIVNPAMAQLCGCE